MKNIAVMAISGGLTVTNISLEKLIMTIRILTPPCGKVLVLLSCTDPYPAHCDE